ncbi:hypothetical protein [Natrarchaeobaculum aegyptiacum]|uniref:DUF7965 domain-containing protein n=1 Tax=Natrarchaeobaculum aegyptiacum TaxID=745377 RepID=A0A2Z2HUU2_9EURY|nr:hypothetical protein [Natrarchaeobaculum aegyptiacum]ARS90961.1 hypothetical protein B1756_15295 [Natrarchaeobaculum aegyptiacum]
MADPDRLLEGWTVGTSALVIVGLGGLLVALLTDVLAAVLPELGTAPATILFGYVWLLTLTAAGQGRIVARSRPLRSVAGDAALAGAMIALIYLTVVLIVGFVAPGPAQLDPGTVPVARVVIVGTIVGAIGGGLLGVFFVGCDRLARRLATRAGDG